MIFNPCIVINNRSYDGNHLNGIIDLNDEGIVLNSRSCNGPYELCR